MNDVYIAATGAYIPSRRLTNGELAERINTSDEWIRSHTGISSRHIADDDEAASDLAVKASRVALERAGVPPEDLGLIILCTSTGDYGAMPSTACIAQEKLGARHAAAFDISAACSGFVYGLEVARCMMAATPKPTLLVGAEIMSRILDWRDRKTCILFGDGAGAVALLPRAEGRGVRRSYLRADGDGASVLKCDDGYRMPPHRRNGESRCLTMNGPAVFDFAVRSMVEVVEHLAAEAGITPADVTHIVPHQANFRIIRAAAKRLSLPVERFFLNIHDVANTSAASIPIALNDLAEANRLNRGDLMITVGFGAGLTYGGNLLHW